MFLIVLSRQPASTAPFLDLKLETTTTQVGDLSLLIAWDNHFSKLHKTDSRIFLIEAIIDLKKEEIESLDFAADEFANKLILNAILVDLARADIHVGKPFLSGRAVYYHMDKDKSTIYLSSHIRLLKQAGVLIKEDKMSVAEYMIFGDIMPPKTLFKDIKILSYGRRLKITFKRNNFSIERENFHFPLKKISQPKNSVISETIVKTLRTTLNGLKPLKNCIAVSFSGGLDSTIIAKITEQEIGNIRGYSLGYPFESEDKTIENYYSKSAGKAVGIKTRQFAISQKQYLEGLIETIAEGEEPRGFLNTPAFTALIQGSPSTDELILFGHGADSLFGWSMLFRLHACTDGLSSKKNGALKRAVAVTLAKNSGLKSLAKVVLQFTKHTGFLNLAALTDKDLADPAHFFWLNTMFADEEYVKRKFNISIAKVISDRKSRLDAFSVYSLYDMLSFYDFEGPQGYNILTKVGEKYGKKTLFPFYTDPLIEYAIQLPWNFKLKQPKYALRLTARELEIPEFIIVRQKMGLDITPKEAYRLLQPCIPLCKNVCTANELKRMQKEDWKKVFTFWFMINYAIWRAIFIENVNPKDLKSKLNQLLENSTPP